MTKNWHYTEAEKKKIYASRIGSNRSDSKLTEKDVKEIRKLYGTFDRLGKFTLRRLGKKFSVTATNIQQIVARITWKHVL